jgi:hypothetical protein
MVEGRSGALVAALSLAGAFLGGCSATQVTDAQTACAAEGVVVTASPSLASHNQNVVNGISKVCGIVATLPPGGLAPATAPATTAPATTAPATTAP